MNKRVGYILSSSFLYALLLLPSFPAFGDGRPDLYSTPGIESTRKYESTSAEEVIDPFGGSLQWRATDLVVPGNGGLDIRVQRTYMSRGGPPSEAFRSAVGVNWKIHFGMLTRYLGGDQACPGPATSRFPVFHAPDGNVVAFYPPSSGSAVYGTHYQTQNFFVSKNRWIARCAYTAGGRAFYTVITPDGLRYTLKQINTNGFRVDWYTSKIQDRNGNAIDVSYIGNNDPYSPYSNLAAPLVSALNTTDNRSVSFSYQNLNDPKKVLLSSISANGRYVNYRYDSYILSQNGFPNQAFLSEVVYPSGESWQYNYNTNFSQAGGYNLAQVRDRFGKWTSYAYGQVTFKDGALPTLVVKRKKTGNTSTTFSGGVIGSSPADDGYWTYVYSPGGYTAQDRTTVIGPTSTVEYDHYGYVTYTNTYDDLRWRPGLLAKKRICMAGRSTCPSSAAIQEESFTWTRQKVSDFADETPGLSYQDVVQPLLAEKITRRDGTVYRTQYSVFDAYGNSRKVVEFGNGGVSRSTLFAFDVKKSPWLIRLNKTTQLRDVVAGVHSTISRTFNPAGNMLSENVAGVSTGFSYDADGNVSSVTDARNHTTRFLSYYRGVARTVNHPDGSRESRTVNATGTVQSYTNGRAKKTNYTWDGMLRIRSVDYPLGSNVNISHAVSGGELLSRTTVRGAFKAVERFGISGGPSAVSKEDVTKAGTRTTVSYRYDPLGRVIFQSLPNNAGRGISTTYDALGRITRTTFADGKSVSYAYRAGNQVVVTDERNFATTLFYRSYGDPDERSVIKMQAPNGVVTEITRDRLGNVRSVKQHGGAGSASYVRDFGYNTRFQLTSRKDPEIGTSIFGRDAVGNMTSRKVNGQPAMTYVYDQRNRLDLVRHSAASALPDVDYVYNANGDVELIRFGDVDRKYVYDANDNLTSETLTVLGMSGSTVRAGLVYSYDGLDQLKSLTYPSGRVVTFVPNGLGQPTQAGPFVTAAKYFPNGQLAQVVFKNGAVSTLGQEPTRLLPNSQLVTSAGKKLVDREYGYDGAGNLTSLFDRNAAASPWVLTYDGLNRLKSAQGRAGTHNYTYDAVGNIKTATLNGSTTTYQYNTQNRLIALDGGLTESYRYDVYGNVSRNASGDYYYNEAGHLTRADALRNIEFGYDGAGMMVSKTVAGDPRYLLYAKSGQLVAELDRNGASVKEYIHLGNRLVASVTSDGAGGWGVSYLIPIFYLLLL